MLADNSHYLLAAAQRRHDDARQRALEAIRIAAVRGEAVTATTLAARAGVSRAFLYANPALIEAIRELRSTSQRPDTVPPRHGATEASCCAGSTHSPNATRNFAARTRTSDNDSRLSTASSARRTRQPDDPLPMDGVSAPIGGLQWERKDDDREIARRVLNLLADRRMLWKDFTVEIEEHCVASANRVREQVGMHLDNPEIGANLDRRLQLLQRLFRDFVDTTGPAGEEWARHRTPGTDPLSMALGRLRGLVGIQVGELAADYDLDVAEELATIVPDQSGWFFERFDSST
jgi:hypothetical protein